MRKPLISVLMPTLNAERFLREAVNSVVDQTYENVELVVVDGGSTDRTLSILKEYAEGGGLKIVKSPPGKGMGHDLNLGLANCSGAFIARLDADDIAFDSRLDDQFKFLCTYPDIELVGSGAQVFWDHSGEYRAPLWPDHIFDEYLVNNPFFHPTLMFHRRLVDDGLMHYDESFKSDEDYELWGRLITQTKTANMNCSTIRYRLHGDNGQRHPQQLHHKKIALDRFCHLNNIYDPVLIDALCEFQGSAFVTNETYKTMRAYALEAKSHDEDPASKRWPKLGWLQHALVDLPNYSEFMVWYTRMKGWRVEA